MKTLPIKYPIKMEGRPPVNSFTLSFYRKKENLKFDSYHSSRSLSFVRGSLLLAIGLYISFAWLDPMISPDVVIELMTIRVISCFLFASAIALTYSKWGVRYFQFLMSSLLLLAGIGLVRMVMIAEAAGGYSYYAGIILAIMYAHTLLRIRFVYASLTTWFIIFLYAMVTSMRGFTPIEVYISNLFFLISANMMGMFASYWLEYYMKAVYWKELLLHDKTKELENEHQRKTDELDDARELQVNMLPQKLPGCDKYDFSFSMNAASEVGGDYYDYHIDEENNLTFGIGDATGHGLKAGIMVTAMKLIFSEHAGNDTLTDFLKRASHSIHLMGFKKLFMAFAIGRLYDDDRLELAGAGMPAALIYRYKSGQIEKIPLKGMPLGTSLLYPYKTIKTVVNPGDIVMLMTDGLAEAFDPGNKMYGYERVEKVLCEMVNETPDRIIERMHLESKNWLGDHPQNDDMTFFIFKRSAVKEKRLPEYAAQPVTSVSAEA